MLLVDHEIEALSGRQIIVPWNPERVQPASYDLALADSLLLENPKPTGDKFYEVSISKASADNPFWLQPGEFCLACTEETLYLPPTISGELCLKSSAARAGYEHSLAGWIDAGFWGRPTLELRNNLQHHSLPLWPGQRLCQLKLFRHGQPRTPYGSGRGSHYQGDRRPMPAWYETPKAPF